MNISDLLAPEAVLASLKAQTKKQLLQELAARAHARTNLPEKQIFETLNERERLGTTGVGAGIAIPHGRMAGATTITGVFARLESAIDYEAVDGQPVDLVFMLLAPENAGADHLKALARVSRLLRNQQTCEKLRAAQSAEALVRHTHRPDRQLFDPGRLVGAAFRLRVCCMSSHALRTPRGDVPARAGASSRLAICGTALLPFPGCGLCRGRFRFTHDRHVLDQDGIHRCLARHGPVVADRHF